MALRHGAKDMAGQRFGFLTVLRRAGSLRKGRSRNKKYAVWLCRCDCGQEVTAAGQLLRKGLRKACARNGHHWNSNPWRQLYPNEYKSWEHMHERCYNKKNDRYRIYGGRGIRVCAEWKDFKTFIHNMGRKPDATYTIERNDVNGNYEPTNCRWATRAEQSRNMRRNVYVVHKGERLLLMDLVAKLGLDKAAVYGRLRIGWSLEEALSLPIREYKKKAKKKKRSKTVRLTPVVEPA